MLFCLFLAECDSSVIFSPVPPARLKHNNASMILFLTTCNWHLARLLAIGSSSTKIHCATEIADFTRYNLCKLMMTRVTLVYYWFVFIEPKSIRTQNGYFLRPNSPVMKGGGRIENMQFCAVLRWHMGDGCGIWGLLGAGRPLYASLSSSPLPVPFIKPSRLHFFAAMTQSPKPNNPITAPHIQNQKL